ncbi:MAG: hypothetical protein NC223_03210 [Butyrivibrio sp.]|nr:hypothetical protein [Butyrivibrio sp.]
MIAIEDVQIKLDSALSAKLCEELLENARTILTTLKGTNPQNRAMGLEATDIIGRSGYSAKGAFCVQAIEQISRYEPRLSVSEVGFEAEDNKIIPKVVLTYNGG